MSDGLATYSFLPWARRGAAAAITTPDTAPAVPARAAFGVELLVNAHAVAVDLELYGPGDVTAFDRRQVVRTEPRAGVTAFEANYFPFIELDRSDYPWLFTPAAAGTNHRLRPWLCLVVVRRQDGVTLKAGPEQPLPVLTIGPPADPAAELPDLADSWAWAHVQVAGDPVTGEALGAVEAAHPERVVSRLICPRRLAPNQRYLACLVPAFRAGVRAGLGQPADEAALEPAWSIDALPATVQLPVYHSWSFQTAGGEDFEALARRLEGRPVGSDVGTITVDVHDPGFGLPVVPSTMEGAVVRMGGALRAPGATEAPWPDPARLPFEAAVTDVLNAPETLTAAGADDPLVTPPFYARWHAAQRTVPADLPRWLRELNLDPRHRATAGLGTRVVQEIQEQLMAAAWEQAGEIEEANRRLRQAQLARSVAGRVHDRLRSTPVDALLQWTGPLQARVRLSPRTLRARVEAGSLPAAATDAAFRRLARPRGPLMRRLLAPGERIARPIVSRLNAREIGAPPAAPTPDAAATIDGVADEVYGRRGLPRGWWLVLLLAVLLPFLAVAILLAAGVLRWLQGRARRAREVRTRNASPAAVNRAPPHPTFEPLAPDEAPPAERPTGGTDSPAAARFRAAARAHLGALDDLARRAARRPAPPLPLPEIRATLLERIEPARTVPEAVLARVRVPPRRAPPEDPIEPILAYPEFPQPMYEPLRDLFQELLFPGADRIPPDTITLLETNPRFIEAYLAGLNHEIGRELLWRGFPTDQRGSYARSFWDGSGRVPPPASGDDAGTDIPELHTWSPARLGEHLTGAAREASLVLLIRGELLRRYPNTIIYAVRAVWDGGRRLPADAADAERYPAFRGTLRPDMTFLGFALTVEEARGSTDPADDRPGWFFVLAEQPTEPRFGLDAADTAGAPAPAHWNDASWGHLAEDAAALAALTHAPAGGRLAGHTADGATWGRDAAHMAFITLQRPFRIAIHADDMLPPAS